MKFELKNVKFLEAFSEETNCFQADLFINGKKIAYVKNDGRGGCTDYNTYEPTKRPILAEAEAYAKTLPEIKWGDIVLKQDLEMVIDNLFEEWLTLKEEKLLQKNCLKSLCFGTTTNYSMISWKGMTIEEVLKNPATALRIRVLINEKTKEGYTLLNKNIPSEFLV